MLPERSLGGWPRWCGLALAAWLLSSSALADPCVPRNPQIELPPHVGGDWGPVLLWPHVPASMANLPDGRILTFASNEPDDFPPSTDDEFTHAAVWDPKTLAIEEVPHPSHDMFCAAMVTLEDGETLVMGGRNEGDSPWVSYFDFHNTQWIQFDTSSQLNRGRWYPTAVYLGSGEVFIAGGVGGGVHPERWSPGAGWTLLTGIDFLDDPVEGPTILAHGIRDGSGSWPLLQLDPTGKIFHHGAAQNMNTLDPFGGPSGLGTITGLGVHSPDSYAGFPDEGVSVLYDEGKILVSGGSTSTSSSTAIKNAYSIDITGPAPVTSEVARMCQARQFHNEVLLPTGDVLIVGGNTSGLKFSDASATRTAEVWDPDANTWTEWNAQDQARTYHSAALLLMDATVLSGGGGLAGDPCPGGQRPPALPGKCGVDHWNAEVFSPPYLFDEGGGLATRPEIQSAPKVLRVGRSFKVRATPGLSAFSLVRMSATTHTMNTDQRFLRPSMVETAPGSYEITLHSNRHVLVPGYWMLFALDGEVPSIARAIQVVDDGKPRGPPISGLRNDLGDEVLFQVEAADPDGNPLTFAGSGLPTGLSLDAETGIISGTVSQAGAFNVALAALDGVDAANITFQWVVSAETSEAGTVATANEWSTVELDHHYEKPVVVMGPPSLSDPSPTTVRVDNVQADRFDVRLEEWLYQDGIHLAEEVSYLVVEAGEYEFPGGGALVAGVTTGIDFENPRTQTFTPGVFVKRPVILAQVTTTHGDAPPVTPRIEDVSVDGFVVRLQEEEAGDQNFEVQTVHWIALEPAQIPGLLEAARSGTSVDETPHNFAFSAGFSDVPHLLANIQTVLGIDPGTVRRSGATSVGFQVFVAEEQSLDAETDHTLEQVGWLAIEPGVTTLGLLPFFNSPPSIVRPADQFGFTSEPVSLFIQALDPEGGVVSFSAADLPPGLTIDSETGEISGSLTATGDYSPSVSAEDPSGDAAQIEFLWTVEDRLKALPFPAPPAVQGSQVEYTAVTNLPGGYEYDWDFGDGAPPVGVSGSPEVSHTFAAPGRYVVTLTVSDPATPEMDVHQFVQNITGPPTALPPTASTSITYEAAQDRVWVVNPDNDSVAVIDALTHTKLAEIPVSADPRTVAVAGDGRVWVACRDAAVIEIIDPSTLGVVQSVGLIDGSMPYSVVFSPSGDVAFVALESLGRVLRLDGSTGAELASQDVGEHVRHMAVSADGAALWIARFVTPLLPNEESGVPQIEAGGSPLGGELLQLDAATLALVDTAVLGVSTIPDSEFSGRGVPNYLGALAISPDGGHMLVPSKQDNVLRGALRDLQALDHEVTVRAITSRVDLASGLEEALARLDHDDASVASATIFSMSGAYAFTALEGKREIAVIDPFSHTSLSRVETGRAPHGLVLSPDGRTLYVDDFMDRTVSVYYLSNLLDFDDGDLPLAAVVSKVGVEALPGEVLLGKRLFYDSVDPRLALAGYMACAACHNDGGQDGRVWDFTDLGEGLRNTIGLTGRGSGHGPLHWSANFDEVQDFEGQIRHFGGLGLMTDADFEATMDPWGAPKAGLSSDLDALAAYVGSLQGTGVSPHRMADGNLTPEAQVGRQVFADQGCGACHRGAAFTDSAPGVVHDVGTLRPSSGPQTALDTPTLRELWRTAPYLHDGSAPTARDAVRAHAGVLLDSADEAALSAYLSQIDDLEPGAPNARPVVSIEGPGDGATVHRGEPLRLLGSAEDIEDGDLSAALSWSSDLQGALGSGGDITLSDLQAGTHRITASVVDSGGESNNAQIALAVNELPQVTIDAPADASVFLEGVAVDLQARATDAEDGPLTQLLSWSSDLDGALGTGGNVVAAALSVGTHTVTASVSDAALGAGSAQITLVVNRPPAVEITSPAEGSLWYAGQPLDLVATAADLEDGDLAAAVVWESNRDGALGTGGDLSRTDLSVGIHVLTASAQDTHGASGSAQVGVTVDPNDVPVVLLTAPSPGALYLHGEEVALRATANDTEDGELTASLSWESNRDGALGAGGALSLTDLSVGTHRLTAWVVDSRGAPGSASVVASVIADAAPMVEIQSPPDGLEVNEGDRVLLAATAVDTEDGDLTDTISWTSDLDGTIGIGGDVTNRNLSQGTHRIRAEAIDSSELPGFAEVSLRVNGGPAVSITAPADGAAFGLNETVELVATAMDPEDGDVGASVVWTSSLDGVVGIGASASYSDFREGLHAVTAFAEDSTGTPGFDQIVFSVPEPRAPLGIAAGVLWCALLRRLRTRQNRPTAAQGAER